MGGLFPERFREAHLRDRTAYFDNPYAWVIGQGCDFVARRKDGCEISVEGSLEFPGAVCHVTSRGNARLDIVADDRSLFLSLFAHVFDRYGWLCHAYCLMDNHYHS